MADVVVVGAGPAGCAAAYDLATQGVRVLLLDRCEFPRKKICAGGLTVKAVEALRYPIGPVIEKTARHMSVSCRMRHQKRLEGIDPICHMVRRSAFDLFCLQQTTAAGAGFELVKRIDRIEESSQAVCLVTNRGVIRARFLIGADGVYSRVRQLTGRFPAFRSGFAVEGMVKKMPPKDLCMGFDFSQVMDGYGWVFPKKDHINVGLYTQNAGVKITRHDLADYAIRRLGYVRPVQVTGYPLGIGGWRYRTGHGRCMLVGDAAGLVDPLLGEGLYHAIVSGQRAAAAVLNAMHTACDACSSYAGLLKPIQRDLLFSQFTATIFYRFPRLGHVLLTSPAASIPLMKGFSQGLPLLDIFCSGYRFWFGMHKRIKHTKNRF